MVFSAMAFIVFDMLLLDTKNIPNRHTAVTMAMTMVILMLNFRFFIFRPFPSCVLFPLFLLRIVSVSCPLYSFLLHKSLVSSYHKTFYFSIFFSIILSFVRFCKKMCTEIQPWLFNASKAVSTYSYIISDSFLSKRFLELFSGTFVAYSPLKHALQ